MLIIVCIAVVTADLCRCFVMVTGLQWEHFPMTSIQTTGHRDLVNCLRYDGRNISSLVQEMLNVFLCVELYYVRVFVVIGQHKTTSCHIMYMCLHVHVPPPLPPPLPPPTHTHTHHLQGMQYVLCVQVDVQISCNQTLLPDSSPAFHFFYMCI